MILIIIITIHNRNIKEMWEKYISLACYKNTIHMLHSIIPKNSYYYQPFPLFWYLWAYWLEWKWKINMKLVERVVRLRPARLFAFSFFPKKTLHPPSSTISTSLSIKNHFLLVLSIFFTLKRIFHHHDHHPYSSPDPTSAATKRK